MNAISRSKHVSWWTIQCLYFVDSLKSEGKCMLSKHSVHDVPFHWLVRMHIDIFFRHNIINVSQRRVNRINKTWWQLCIHFRNVQSVSFNSRDTGILMFLNCGICEFIKVLHSNILLRHNRWLHCPQRSWIFRHPVSMSKKKWCFKRPHNCLLNNEVATQINPKLICSTEDIFDHWN